MQQIPTQHQFLEDVALALENNGGYLTAEESRAVCDKNALAINELMLSLLPLAAEHAIAPVSDFRVGAVIRGVEDEHGQAALYLGANLEFKNCPVQTTLHAEQAALANAWLSGEQGITALAVTAAPCGHCRQFLNEAVVDGKLDIFMLSHPKVELSGLLPSAFGPADLGFGNDFMKILPSAKNLELDSEKSDSLIIAALDVARTSYAPYTKNYAGCSLLTKSGEIISGASADNAAFNPGLPAVVAALSQLRMKQISRNDIKRIVLVEHQSQVSQKSITETLAKNYLGNIKLEYFTCE